MVVAVASEPVRDLVVPAPRMDVQEHRQVMAVEELGVAEVGHPVADDGPERATGRLGPRLPRRARVPRASADVHPLVDLAVQTLLLVQAPGQVGTGHTARRDRPRDVAEHVVLRVGVTEAAEQLWVCGEDVEGLHQRLLRASCSRAAFWGCAPGVAVPERPAGEEGRQLAEEVGQRLAARVRIDDHEGIPAAQRGVGPANFAHHPHTVMIEASLPSVSVGYEDGPRSSSAHSNTAPLSARWILCVDAPHAWMPSPH